MTVQFQNTYVLLISVFLGTFRKENGSESHDLFIQEMKSPINSQLRRLIKKLHSRENRAFRKHSENERVQNKHEKIVKTSQVGCLVRHTRGASGWLYVKKNDSSGQKIF